jgi:serine/threonine-protein kinase
VSTSEAELPVAIGDVLAGKYRVDSVLGVGGMGIVVAATHVQLEQKVALKFLLPAALQSKEAVERFLREARAAVRLKSEHVAKVSDVGTLDSGAPYMVMEFLKGADLGRIVQETPLGIEESVSFLLQACEAIAEAHSLGIVHRDIKPQNLFVTRRVDGRPLIKVLDFGISKTIDTQTGLSLTRTSSIMGSPLYMSPEQMRSSKTVDSRTDIWALGVVLYELLTGRVPWEAEAVPELCLKVVQDDPDPPKSLKPEIPEGLQAVILKCLRKKPDDRFSNVAELANALEPYAPIESRGSAERIALTLQVPSRPPMVSISPDASSRNPKVGTGGTAWGATQALPASKSRRNLVVGGSVGALVLVVSVVAAAKAFSGGGPQPAATGSSTTTTTTTATTPTAVETQAPVASANPTTTTTAPATVTATTTATTPPAATTAPHATSRPTATVSTGAASAKRDAGVAPAATVTAPPKNFE